MPSFLAAATAAILAASSLAAPVRPGPVGWRPFKVICQVETEGCDGQTPCATIPYDSMVCRNERHQIIPLRLLDENDTVSIAGGAYVDRGNQSPYGTLIDEQEVPNHAEEKEPTTFLPGLPLFPLPSNASTETSAPEKRGGKPPPECRWHWYKCGPMPKVDCAHYICE